jgi:hypothetical protein
MQVELLELSRADLHTHIKPHFPDFFEALKTLAETRARWMDLSQIKKEMAKRSEVRCKAIHDETKLLNSQKMKMIQSSGFAGTGSAAIFQALLGAPKKKQEKDSIDKLENKSKEQRTDKSPRSNSQSETPNEYSRKLRGGGHALGGGSRPRRLRSEAWHYQHRVPTTLFRFARRCAVIL